MLDKLPKGHTQVQKKNAWFASGITDSLDESGSLENAFVV
jgi:hypothetical protein